MMPLALAFPSNVECGCCDHFFYVIPDQGVAFCPRCETPEGASEAQEVEI